jgi:hypothetical protein
VFIIDVSLLCWYTVSNCVDAAFFITPETTVRTLKKDIKAVISAKEEKYMGRRKISWFVPFLLFSESCYSFFKTGNIFGRITVLHLEHIDCSMRKRNFMSMAFEGMMKSPLPSIALTPANVVADKT